MKIESHYVEMPQWKNMVDHGARNFVMALGESTFLDRNVPRRNRPAVDAFRRELLACSARGRSGNRGDAREAVAAAARWPSNGLEIAPTAVVLEYLCGATNALDPYSAYLTPDQLNDVYAQIEGNFVGLGVELKAQDGGLVDRAGHFRQPRRRGRRPGRRSDSRRRRPIDRVAFDRSGRQSAARPGREHGGC